MKIKRTARNKIYVMSFKFQKLEEKVRLSSNDGKYT